VSHRILELREEEVRRLVIGDVSSINLDDARQAARQMAASVAYGSNPSVERKKKFAAGTVLEVIEAYLPHAKERQRPRSFKETERHLRIQARSIHHERADTRRRGARPEATSSFGKVLTKICGRSQRLPANLNPKRPPGYFIPDASQLAQRVHRHLKIGPDGQGCQ
jgi:hypothetical protein